MIVQEFYSRAIRLKKMNPLLPATGTFGEYFELRDSMKHFILILLLLYASAQSQLLSWSPTFPTVNDTITIIYDAKLGNAGLLGESVIYAHTGVLAAASNSSSDWKYVKTSWGENTSDTRMTPLDNETWMIRFHIKTYYKLPHDVQVTHLAFVFRNASGSRTGKTTTNGDIFLPITPPGLFVGLLEPRESFLMVQPHETITMTAVSRHAEQTRLFDNQQLLCETTDDTLRYTFTASDNQRHLISVIASDQQNLQDSTGFYYMARPRVTTAPLPAGVQDGINEISPTKVTLVLFAPNKDFTYVIGDFSDWYPHPEYDMNRTPDQQRWWITLDSIEPGKEAAFQYFIDHAVKIADPYAEKFLDPQYDRQISSQTYPDLLPYPEGETTGIVSVFQTDETPFAWTDADFTRPDPRSLVIYELLIRDFIREHTFSALIDSLPYLQRLGINAVELMPICEFEGNSSWGYNPSFYFAPDKYYGPKDDLKQFINACHEKGIAVILDMVYNHSTCQHSLAQLYWDAGNNRPAADNLWYNVQTPAGQHCWGFLDFDHESQHTQQFFDRVNRFWLQNYHVDGFRFDFTKGFTNTPGSGDTYDPRRVALLKRMVDEIRKNDESAYVILEHWGCNQEEKELAEYGMMLWGNANYNFNEASMGYHENGKSDFSWAGFKKRGWNVPHLVSYMESHDEERLMYKNLQWGNESGSYDVKDLPTALQRMQAAGAFCFLLPGPKMLWQFGELGYDYSIDYNGRVGEKPIRWNYYQHKDRRALYDAWSRLIHLKTNEPLFQSPEYRLNASSSVKSLLISSEHQHAVIVGNFDVVAKTTTLLLPHDGVWYDYLCGSEITFSSASPQLTLAPGEFFVYLDERIGSYIEDPQPLLPLQFKLYANVPNPFNSQTTITYSLDKQKWVNVSVFSIQGRRIKDLVDDAQGAGEHKVSWDGRDDGGLPVASGIYLCRLQAGSKRMIIKMTLVR